MNYAKMSKIKYLFYILIHPVTGFEELKYNKKGSVLIANILCVLFYLSNVIQQVMVAFIFRQQEVKDVNIIWLLVGSLGGLLVWNISNWMFCTLLDGKGRFTELWVASCYALLPYIMISIPLTFLGHLFTIDEAVFYNSMNIILISWSVVLLFIGTMSMHQFSISKNILTCIFTIIGIFIILFLVLLLYTLLRNVYVFILTLSNEIMFRI